MWNHNGKAGIEKISFCIEQAVPSNDLLENELMLLVLFEQLHASLFKTKLYIHI